MDEGLRRTAANRVGRLTREWRLAELKFVVTSPLKASFVKQRGRDGRGKTQIQRVDIDDVVTEVISGAGVGRLRLNAGRRIPAQTIVGDRESIAGVDVPINLRQEERLISPSRHLTGKAVQEVKRVVNLRVGHAARRKRRAVSSGQFKKVGAVNLAKPGKLRFC